MQTSTTIKPPESVHLSDTRSSTAAGSDIISPDEAQRPLSSIQISDGQAQKSIMDENQPSEGAGFSIVTDIKEVRGKLLSTNWAVFVAGVNDAATGALIPYIQTAYNVGLLFVAMSYLVNFIGFLTAAFTNVHISARLGTGGTMVFGASLQILAYSLMCWKPPFPLYIICFFFTGMGVGYQDAQANTYIASMPNAYRWLGILHGIYGAGALVAPILATLIASQTGYWERYYFIPLGFAVINVVLLAWTFRKGLFQPNAGKGSTAAKETASRELRQALSNWTVWTLSAFFFLYVGAEVTAGGWVVQFLISVRNGKPSEVGYVASGFWGGLTLGRFVLADITNKLGERRMIFVYLILALACQLSFWFVPNVIGDAVVISLLGFFIAPFFPVGINVLTKSLPRELHIAAVGFTATFGQAGSAAFPFLTGAIASSAGVQVLQPIMVGLLVGMGVLWSLMPRVKQPNH